MELPPVPLAPRRPFYEISKRGFDIGVSALLLALLSPLLAACWRWRSS